MKNCELCKSPAQTYCESDQAILCWDCDANVHGANFLVARHSRSLLCNECKSPTPWNASGVKLGRTVSVCDGCATGVAGRCEDESDGDLDSDSEFESEEEEDREEEGENQVVPWSSSPPSPPAASSSSSDDDCSETATMLSRKRVREDSPDLDLHSPDRDDRSTFSDSARSLKSRRAAARKDSASGN